MKIKEANQHSDHAPTNLAYTDSPRTQIDKFKQQITTLATNSDYANKRWK